MWQKAPHWLEAELSFGEPRRAVDIAADEAGPPSEGAVVKGGTCAAVERKLAGASWALGGGGGLTRKRWDFFKKTFKNPVLPPHLQFKDVSFMPPTPV